MASLVFMLKYHIIFLAFVILLKTHFLPVIYLVLFNVKITAAEKTTILTKSINVSKYDFFFLFLQKKKLS
jgi:hypothetical protein